MASSLPVPKVVNPEDDTAPRSRSEFLDSTPSLCFVPKTPSPRGTPQLPEFGSIPNYTVATYLRKIATSEMILLQFMNKIGLVNLYLDPAHISANGDVKADIGLAQAKLENEGNQAFAQACLHIYGLTNMDGSTELTLPTRPVELPKWGMPHIVNDQDMIAILNARGTVVLNMLFAGSPEQRAIVKLADAALCIFQQWAFEAPFCTTTEMKDQTMEYQRYKKMVLVIREDIHIHFLLFINSRIPAGILLSENVPFCNILRESIETWRWFCQGRQAFNLMDDVANGVTLTTHAQQHWSFMIDIQDILRVSDCDFRFLDDLQMFAFKNGKNFPVNGRSQYMGGVSQFDPYPEFEDRYGILCRKAPEPEQYNPRLGINFPGLEKDRDGNWFKWRWEVGPVPSQTVAPGT